MRLFVLVFLCAITQSGVADSLNWNNFQRLIKVKEVLELNGDYNIKLEVNNKYRSKIKINKIELVSLYFAQKIDYFKTFYKIEFSSDKIEDLEDVLELKISNIEDLEIGYSLDYTPNDYNNHNMWHLDAIDAQKAWNITTGSNIIVAVIDAGFQLDHPDLKDNVYINSGEIPNNGIDDDNNGLIDDVSGYDFADMDNDLTMCGSSNIVARNHGTGVAGTIGAVTNNSKGISSIGFNVKIYPIKIFKDNPNPRIKLPIDDIIDAFKLCENNNIKIINFSVGLTEYSESLHQLILFLHEQNFIIIGSAGNRETGSSMSFHFPHYLPEVISVGAINKDLEFPVGWVKGPHIDICAPGVNITALKGSSVNQCLDYDYDIVSGTSYAAPLVSGAIALLRSIDPNLTFQQIKRLLIDGSTPIKNVPTEFKNVVGNGILNVYNSIKLLQSAPEFELDAPYPKVCKKGRIYPRFIQTRGITVPDGNIIWKVYKNGQLYISSNDRNPLFMLPETGEYEFQLTLSNTYGSTTKKLGNKIIVAEYMEHFSGKEDNCIIVRNGRLDLDERNELIEKKMDQMILGKETEAICNSEGVLLFYADNKRIYNRDGLAMIEGPLFAGYHDEYKDIQIGGPDDFNIENNGQNKIIVPILTQKGSHRYLIIHIGEYKQTKSIYPNTNLFYTIVNMDLNNGMGGIESDQFGIVLNRPFGEGVYNQNVTATLNCDYSKVWVVVANLTTEKFETYVIDKNSDMPVLNSANKIVVTNTADPLVPLTTYNKFTFSPKQNMFLFSNKNYAHTLLNFNYRTGFFYSTPLSHPLQINNSNPINCYNWTGTPQFEFSNDGNNIYYLTHNVNVISSKNNTSFGCSQNQINTFSIPNSTLPTYGFLEDLYNGIHILPNGKILISSQYRIPNYFFYRNYGTLDIIANPNNLTNLAQNSCEYQKKTVGLIYDEEAVKYGIQPEFVTIGKMFPNYFISKVYFYLHNHTSEKIIEKRITIRCINKSVKIELPIDAPSGSKIEYDFNGGDMNFIELNSNNEREITIDKSINFDVYIRDGDCYYKKIKYIITLDLSPPEEILETRFICDDGTVNPETWVTPKDLYGGKHYILQSSPTNARADFWDSRTSIYNGISGPISHSLPTGTYTISIFDEYGCLIKIVTLTIGLRPPAVQLCSIQYQVNTCGEQINLYQLVLDACPECAQNIVANQNWTIDNRIINVPNNLLIYNFQQVVHLLIAGDCDACEIDIQLIPSQNMNPRITEVNYYLPLDETTLACCKDINYMDMQNIFMMAMSQCLGINAPLSYKIKTIGSSLVFDLYPPNPIYPNTSFRLCANNSYEIIGDDPCCALKLNLFCSDNGQEYFTSSVELPPSPPPIEKVLDNNKKLDNISLVPNPTSQSFSIKSVESNLVQVEIKNNIGAVVRVINNYIPDSSINIENFASGIYYITITQNNQKQTLKLIKN